MRSSASSALLALFATALMVAVYFLAPEFALSAFIPGALLAWPFMVIFATLDLLPEVAHEDFKSFYALISVLFTFLIWWVVFLGASRLRDWWNFRR